MTLNHNLGTTASISKPQGQRILPLPEDVIAQIKSSTTIVSLDGVVLELLKNSLDAKATKVEITVDFARGGCIVEDDGLGISPLEFGEAGGLGKLYCTSKYHAGEALLGCNGTFLASLAAMSLLTITSNHHEYRSHNSITFHHSKAVERQLPASDHHKVHNKHGTRVTVRNLFGNLPVRVKQRSVVSEHRFEQDRLWAGLKRDVVGLLLSWHGNVSIRIRSADSRVALNFNTLASHVPPEERQSNAEKRRSAQLSYMLNVLTQANLITIDDWASWVPASASTSSVSIKGAISLNPAPSKQVQYISLGNRPLFVGTGHNELVDEINRLFAVSSFGTIEDDLEVDELEKIRRQRDKRFKHDGYTKRQLRVRKDVDRYPMFHLRISLKDNSASNPPLDQSVDDDTMLKTAVDVLGAMVTQWLSVHHFRPRQNHRRRPRPNSASTSANDSSNVRHSPRWDNNPISALRPSTGNANSRKVLRPSDPPLNERKSETPRSSTLQATSIRPESTAFAQWSRIKSGKADFYDAMAATVKPGTRMQSLTRGLSNIPADPQERAEPFASFDVDPLARGALNLPGEGQDSTMHMKDILIGEEKPDNAVLWTDPSTKKTYVLNARTGCVVPGLRQRPTTETAVPLSTGAQREPNRSLRLVPKSAGALLDKTPFLDNVLQAWDNPVFRSSEMSIQQIFQDENSSGSRPPHHHCSRTAMNEAFGAEASAFSSGRLSKHALHRAEVIAQVDKKFILVKMRSLSNDDVSNKAEAETLVLLDQHAADERVQVEDLLQELCTPIDYDTGSSGYKSKLGHHSQITSTLLEKPVQFTISTGEQTHFTAYASRFAAWGVLYDILSSASSSHRSDKSQYLLSVTSLPPAISARCRADPQILISFLRSTVWKYAEDKHLSLPPSTSSSTVGSNNDWVRRLATCPQGLIDMVNSRACRLAIMFNDELSLDECKALVSKLATCTFPFMCAHGRPSMVPLVDLGAVESTLGGIGSSSGQEGIKNEQDGKSFAEAWKTWQKNV